MKRVVLTGSESTGKTTLAERLAKHYDATLVPEFVRTYAATLGRTIDFSDHGAIAKGQMALEDEHIALEPALLVQDTDLLSTVVYCKHYFGSCPAWIAEAANSRRPDLYIMCDIDIPWVADGVRDRGHAREEMQQLFRDALTESGVLWLSIGGDAAERFARASHAIDNVIRD
jgi:NadR type nicotinamide-nucleotide adenylyltransferase